MMGTSKVVLCVRV